VLYFISNENDLPNQPGGLIDLRRETADTATSGHGKNGRS